MLGRGRHGGGRDGQGGEGGAARIVLAISKDAPPLRIPPLHAASQHSMCPRSIAGPLTHAVSRTSPLSSDLPVSGCTTHCRACSDHDDLSSEASQAGWAARLGRRANVWVRGRTAGVGHKALACVTCNSGAKGGNSATSSGSDTSASVKIVDCPSSIPECGSGGGRAACNGQWEAVGAGDEGPVLSPAPSGYGTDPALVHAGLPAVIRRAVAGVSPPIRQHGAVMDLDPDLGQPTGLEHAAGGVAEAQQDRLRPNVLAVAVLEGQQSGAGGGAGEDSSRASGPRASSSKVTAGSPTWVNWFQR